MTAPAGRNRPRIAVSAGLRYPSRLRSEASHEVALRCPAKLNLGLEVLERDAQSGYHRIASVFQAIGLHDRLSISIADGPWAVPSLELSGPFAGELSAQSNSLLAAWALLGGSQAFPALRVELKKHIPAQSGLGGAGSDGAGMLLGLRELARLLCLDAEQGGALPPGSPESALDGAERLAALQHCAALTDDELAALAARIGSDTAFFVRAGCQYAQGRGELLEPLARGLDFCALLAVPDFGSATASAYNALARGTQRREPVCMPLLRKALEAADWDMLRGALVNDFEPVLFGMHPEYAAWFGIMQDFGAQVVSLTGSGSGFYGLCDNESAAAAALDQLSVAGRFRLVEITKPLRS